MPELPDVERFKRYLDATALHKKIESVRVRDRQILSGLSAKTLERCLEGVELRPSPVVPSVSGCAQAAL